MLGKALAWIKGLRYNNLLSTWARFIEDVRERFGMAEFENKLEELSRLQQTSTMAEYLERFEGLLNEVEG